MTLASGIAIYFIVWWVCLFVVLPWGIRNAHETGEEVAAGNEAGAPVNPMIVKKILWTTIVATIVFMLIYGQMTYSWITFDDIPYVNSLVRE
jgi:predicted secreted protein